MQDWEGSKEVRSPTLLCRVSWGTWLPAPIPPNHSPTSSRCHHSALSLTDDKGTASDRMKNLNGTKLQYYSKYPTPPHYPLIFPKVNALWNKNSHFLTIWFNMLSYQSLWVLFLFEICHPKPVSCQSGARFIRSPTQFQGKDWSTNRLEIHPVRTVKDHYQSLDIFPPLKVEWLIFFCSLIY